MAITPCAAADYWYEHYDRALQAIEEGEWEAAVEELNEALARKGDSGARTRSYGLNVVPYFPYLQLGIAYFRLGHHDAALQAFDTELQLGAIKESPPDQRALEAYQARAVEAKERLAADEQRIVDEIVLESLREADELRADGRLQEALERAGRALAVHPGHPEAEAVIAELRGAVAEAQRRRDDAARADDLLARARVERAQGRVSEAASLLREAVDLDPSPEAVDALAEAESTLVASLREERDQAERRAVLDAALASARQHEQAGRYAEALTELQPVLAVEPENTEASEVYERVTQARRDAVERALTDESLLLASAEFESGNFEAAVVAANRVLAIDPGHAGAVELIGRAYAEIGRLLLGGGPRRNIPPAIRFADSREEVEDGSRWQLERSRGFRLSGVVIDESPVQVGFFAPDGSELPGEYSSQLVGEVYVSEFVLTHTLAQGRSAYRVVATDGGGLSSSAEYGVMYTRPLLRTPWFLAFLAALGVLVAAVPAWLRAARRRRLRRRRFNPYVAGAPVLDGRLFFGREQLIARILETVHNNSLLLFGERRIGKTTLQHQLKRRLEAVEDPDYEFYPVYIDLQGTPEERFFATVAEDIWEELEGELGDLRPGPNLNDGSAFGYRELVAELRRVLDRLTRSTSKQVKIVLLIDEVDELNAYDPRINQKLRSLFMKSFAEHLVAVVSGVEIRRQWERQGSPWYNFFEEVEVSAIDERAAEELIVRPIRGVFTIDDGVVARIIELTDCKPYLIQRLCVSLVNRLHDENRRTMTVADVEAVGRPVQKV